MSGNFCSSPEPAGLGVTGRIPENLEQATGVELAELKAIASGNTVSVFSLILHRPYLLISPLDGWFLDKF